VSGQEASAGFARLLAETRRSATGHKTPEVELLVETERVESLCPLH
jgi:hypothetical protein